jgi:hypothetical protein
LRTHALSWAHAAELTERVYRELRGRRSGSIAMSEA